MMNKKTTLLIINSLVIITVIYALILFYGFRDYYFITSQEDEYIEWSTFWGFLTSSIIYWMASYKQSQNKKGFPWFLIGVGLFCFLVAMEEISWGQRIFGFQPPTYFLEKNIQQEVNIHNFMGNPLRQLIFESIIILYGVVLPFFTIIPEFKEKIDKLIIISPPLLLIPSYIFIFTIQNTIPSGFVTEWIELMLALSFTFSAIYGLLDFTGTYNPKRYIKLSIIVWFGVILLGVLSSFGTRLQRDDNPNIAKSAMTELKALATDFESKNLKYKCGLHKRVYSVFKQRRLSKLLNGKFSNLQKQGLPKNRANFFLDPWGYQYWIRDYCASKKKGTKRYKLIYSFGPNRRRESIADKPLGDDLGIYVRD